MSGLSREQLAIRRTRIGGSEIGAILGVNPHRSALSVFNDKVLSVADEPSDAMRWGSSVEGSILAYHAQRDGLALTFPGTLVHPTLDYVCATPDAIGIADTGKRVIEAKNCNAFAAGDWGEEDDEAAPFHHLAQVQWTIGVVKALGLAGDDGDLVPCIGGSPPRVYRVTFDPELFGIMVDRAERFVVDHLRPGKPPAMDGSPAADEYLRRKYGVQHGEELLPFDDRADVLRFEVLNMEQRIKDLELANTKARQEICAMIGEAAGIEGVATWKRCKDSIEARTDWKLVAALVASRFDVPQDVFEAIAEEHTIDVVTRQGSRRLTLTRPPRAKKAKAA